MKYLLLIALLCIFGCNSPNPDFDKYTRLFNSKDTVYFRKFDALKPRYSLLIFGMGYHKANLKVENCDNFVYNDTVKTNYFKPLAKVYRIENSCETVVNDLSKKCTFKIKPDMSQKYKFIYVDYDFETKKITTNYLNNHMPIL